MLTKLTLAALAATGLALLAAPALAQDTAATPAMTMAMEMAPEVTLGDLTITGGFTRATLPNAPVGGGYVTIHNAGAEADRLIGASSPVAEVTQLHEMKMEGDVMKMNQLEGGIDIPAGETVTLAPGGLHIMFMGLNQPLVEGETVPVTLSFEKAGTVKIELSVAGMAAKGPAMDHAGHGG